MAVPKRKVSRSRRDSRSANKHLKPKKSIFCKNEVCKSTILPHTVCHNCGYYKGVQIVKVKSKKASKKQSAEKGSVLKKSDK
jgi:large subunit ribosomal protein L32